MATVNPSGPGTAYPTARRTAAPTTTRTEKGMSLARGPALILGTILTAAGLYLLYKARTFPPFSNFPNGDAPKDRGLHLRALRRQRLDGDAYRRQRRPAAVRRRPAPARQR